MTRCTGQMDGDKYKKPTVKSAPEYVVSDRHPRDGASGAGRSEPSAPSQELLMSWVEGQLNDQTLFPVEIGELLSRACTECPHTHPHACALGRV